MPALGLIQRQTGGLAMTPRMQQALSLLQRTNLEITAWLAQEIEANPLIELDGVSLVAVEPGEAPDGTADRMEDWLADAPADTLRHDEDGGGIIPDEVDGGMLARAAAPSVRERLEEQLRLAAWPQAEHLIGLALLGLLDDAGRLEGRIKDIADALETPEPLVNAVRQRMMAFDPVGCFASSLAECLAAQLRVVNRLDPAMQTLLDHLDLLPQGDVVRLRRLCGVDEEDFTEMLAELRALDPKPGFDPQGIGVVAVPDVIVRRTREGWQVMLNDETLPRVRVNRALGVQLERGDKAARAYGQERGAHATWLARTLAQRSRTILAVSRAIVSRQAAFLDQGVIGLRPLSLRQIAEATGLHESTISRTTAQRFIDTPRGVLPLRAFFATGLGGREEAEAVARGIEAGPRAEVGHSADAIRQKIRTMIDQETLAAILSDDAITAALQAEGVDIMRRTVAKYREGMGIANSAKRRRLRKAGL